MTEPTRDLIKSVINHYGLYVAFVSLLIAGASRLGFLGGLWAFIAMLIVLPVAIITLLVLIDRRIKMAVIPPNTHAEQRDEL